MRILLADDHKLLRDGERQLLANLTPKTEIFEAGTLDDALAMAANAGRIDLVLLAQTTPGMDGTIGIGTFRAQFPLVKLVLLTATADPPTILAAVDAGVDGVILKTISGQGMVNVVRLVAAGEVYLPSEVVIALARLACGPATRKNSRLPADTGRNNFSPSETEVVPLLLEGLSSKIIAIRIGVEETAIKSRLRTIYKKLGAINRAQAVKALIAAGRAV